MADRVLPGCDILDFYKNKIEETTVEMNKLKTALEICKQRKYGNCGIIDSDLQDTAYYLFDYKRKQEEAKDKCKLWKKISGL